MAKKFFIETFGCQMNDLDSQKIAGSLVASGMESVSDPSRADIIVFNTCSIREKAVEKVYARLGEVKRYGVNGRVVVGVVGCMAQLEGSRILERAPFVKLIAGPQKGNVISELVERAGRSEAPVIDLRMDDDPEPLESAHILRESPWRAGVTISEGCNRRCAFCVVPFTRGPEKNRPSGNIIREVEELAQRGYVEIVLLGQTVNSYEDPSADGLGFAALLRRLASIGGIRRIRYTSPHPSDFTDELLDVLGSCPQVCDHVHLPVQSGSTRILVSMRRGYTRERYLETVRKIQRLPRRIAVATDIIVGFPGETDTDFGDTLSLLDEVQYDSVFSFKYSPRPNTAALTFSGDVPEREKGSRLQRLQAHQKLIQYNKNAAHVGETLEVLADGPAKSNYALAGRATNGKVVNFDGPTELIGTFVNVEITGFSANSLRGVWVAQ